MTKYFSKKYGFNIEDYEEEKTIFSRYQKIKNNRKMKNPQNMDVNVNDEKKRKLKITKILL